MKSSQCELVICFGGGGLGGGRKREIRTNYGARI